MTAAIFDAFGTLLKIQSGQHPYRRLLKIGVEQGRRSAPDDAHVLMTEPLESLAAAAKRLGISVNPRELDELERVLAEEVAGIEAFPDGIEAVALLQSQGVRVAVCSNLASPYRQAITKHYPALDGYVFSCDIGHIKPAPEIYKVACKALNASPEQTHMVGDSARCDTYGPRESGIKGYLLDRSGQSGQYSDLLSFAQDLLRAKP
jgi:HAD superfamily hydrolase (TIGR01549 family)